MYLIQRYEYELISRSSTKIKFKFTFLFFYFFKMFNKYLLSTTVFRSEMVVQYRVSQFSLFFLFLLSCVFDDPLS